MILAIANEERFACLAAQAFNETLLRDILLMRRSFRPRLFETIAFLTWNHLLNRAGLMTEIGPEMAPMDFRHHHRGIRSLGRRDRWFVARSARLFMEDVSFPTTTGRSSPRSSGRARGLVNGFVIRG